MCIRDSPTPVPPHAPSPRLPQVAVDETNHRDVNHTFASMARDQANPFVQKHVKDAVEATKYWQETPGAVAALQALP